MLRVWGVGFRAIPCPHSRNAAILGGVLGPEFMHIPARTAV